jgi:tetratricopeptide (TPR) repeat protein
MPVATMLATAAEAGLEPLSALTALGATASSLDLATPTSPAARAHRGIEFFLRGEFGAAVEAFTDAIELDPREKAHVSNRSAAYIACGRQRDFALALADADACIDLAPEWPKGHYRRGLALRSMSQFSSAEAAFKKGLALARAAIVAGARAGGGVGGGGTAVASASSSSDEADDVAAAAAAGYSSSTSVSSAAAAAMTAHLSTALQELYRMATFEDGVAEEGGGPAATPRLRDVPLAELAAEVADENDRFYRLEQWLQAPRGGQASSSPSSSSSSTFPYLYMRKYGEGSRGVHLRTDVPPETEVMAIGLDHLITVEMGRACPLGRKIAASGVERDLSASKHCYLAAFVLWDRTNPASFFRPYYEVLPAAYPNMPIFWSREELSWLDGSYLLQQVDDRKANIRADYDLLVRAAPDFAAYSLDDFSWARMMVASRNFGIVVDGIRTDALVPYADMLNHMRPRQTRWAFDNRKRQFVIISMQALHVGAQVFDSYGKKCNSRFLLNYGFAVDHNADDDIGQNHNEVRFLVTMQDPAVDPWYARKAELLGTSPA